MNVVLVHGFNVKDGGKKTTGKLVPFFSRLHKVHHARYGWFGLLGVRFFNASIARTVCGFVEPWTCGIGHSNGCDILLRAARLGAPFDQLILINPALDKTSEFPRQLREISVFYNPTDDTVRAAKWLPFHHWGEMGRTGYRGPDKRVKNYNEQVLFNCTGHSGVFGPKSIVTFGRLVNGLISTKQQPLINDSGCY